MSSEWQDVPLGAFLTRRTEQPTIHPDEVYSRLTMAINGKGVRLRDRVRGRELGTAKYVARSGDLMISKIDARKGAAAVLPDELDGVIVTGDFLPFVVSTGVADPAFLDLVVRTPDFARKCDLISGGTTNRVRLDVKRLPELTFLLPPLEGQRRIVDLVRTIDTHLARLAVEVEALTALRAAAARDHFATQAGQPLGDVVGVSQGKSLPLELQGTRSGPIPWFKLSDMLQPGNEFGYRSAASCFDAESLATAGGLVHPVGTVCFARVGAAVKTEKKRLIEVEGALDENHIALHPVSPEDGDYLLCVMEGIRLGEHVRSGAVPSLNQGLVKALKVPWSNDSAERQELSALWGSMRRTIRSLSQEAAKLRQFRTLVLSALLSRDVVLPETYDRLLDVGVA